VEDEANAFESFGVVIADSEITRFERMDVFEGLLAHPVELWRLEYRLTPDDPDKLVLAGDIVLEDGRITEDGAMGRPVLVLSRETDADATQYLGCLWIGGDYDLATPAGRETALRALLEDSELLPRETFDGEHALAQFPLSTGETCQLLLSRPTARDGADAGIWCVERWMDGNGRAYYVTPPTNTLRAAEYYAELQRQCDEVANPAQTDPLQVALAFVTEELGQNVTSDDLTLRFAASAEDFYETPVSRYIGFISNFKTDSMSFYLDRIEWLTQEEDADRLRALGVDPDSLPNGFYIHNPASYPDYFSVNEQTQYEIIRPGETVPEAVDMAGFVEHLARFTESAPPFRVVTKDGYVRSISEQYVP
jgi:hypothetical protein